MECYPNGIRSSTAASKIKNLINDGGIQLDMVLVEKAIQCDEQFRQKHMEEAQNLTGLDNPNSTQQLKCWLEYQGMEVESLSKASVKHGLTTRWKEQIDSEKPLTVMRAKQMQELVEQGKIGSAIPELVQMVLEKVVVQNEGEFDFHFLDGTSMKAIIKEN